MFSKIYTKTFVGREEKQCKTNVLHFVHLSKAVKSPHSNIYFLTPQIDSHGGRLQSFTVFQISS
jgi:hypothetical protein